MIDALPYDDKILVSRSELVSVVREIINEIIPQPALEVENLKRAEAIPAKDVQKIYPKLTVSALATMRCRGEGPAYVKRGERVFYRPEDLRKYYADRIQKTIDQD